jgi:hypothetical protein
VREDRLVAFGAHCSKSVPSKIHGGFVESLRYRGDSMQSDVTSAPANGAWPGNDVGAAPHDALVEGAGCRTGTSARTQADTISPQTSNSSAKLAR